MGVGVLISISRSGRVRLSWRPWSDLSRDPCSDKDDPEREHLRTLGLQELEVVLVLWKGDLSRVCEM